jgi:hypothetical protein
MTTEVRDYEVIDKYGQVIRRTKDNGIVADGEGVRVRLSLMDAANPGLIAAAALADSIKRNEAFDARGHRPGFLPMHDAAASDAAREARDARVCDSWRNPPAVADQSQQQTTPAATTTSNLTRDELVAQRDKRLENAWRS